MYARLRKTSHWTNMKFTLEQYVRNCHECARSHPPRDKTPGFLKPLPIPDRPFQHLTMDFMSYPVNAKGDIRKDSQGYDTVFVVMDRLSKKSISISCYKTCNSQDLAQLFLTHVWRHQGFPESIVSDRGPQFLSAFWDEVCKVVGTKIKLSTAFHSQTDGQTESMT